MGLGELLDRIRAMYSEQFLGAIGRFQQLQVTVLSEVALRDADGQATREGSLGLPARIDLVAVAQDGSMEQVGVDSNSLLKFAPITFEWRRA